MRQSAIVVMLAMSIGACQTTDKETDTAGVTTVFTDTTNTDTTDITTTTTTTTTTVPVASSVEGFGFCAAAGVVSGPDVFGQTCLAPLDLGAQEIADPAYIWQVGPIFVTVQ